MTVDEDWKAAWQPMRDAVGHTSVDRRWSGPVTSTSGSSGAALSRSGCGTRRTSAARWCLSIGGFRMTSFNLAGRWSRERPGEGQAADRAPGLLDLEVRSENDEVVTVGPGTVTVSLPRRG
jgi:hypothetical protein